MEIVDHVEIHVLPVILVVISPVCLFLQMKLTVAPADLFVQLDLLAAVASVLICSLQMPIVEFVVQAAFLMKYAAMDHVLIH